MQSVMFSRLMTGLLGLGLSVTAIAGPITVKAFSRDPAVAALSTEALIDQLQNEVPGDPEQRWPAMVPAFQPLDVPARSEQNFPRETRSPIMAELIRRGVDAVPLLLAHLEDARLTRLIEYHQPGMMNDGGIWFSDVYQPRRHGTQFDPPVNHEVDFKSTRELKAGQSYTVKVGDLCFFALGQIVNRSLSVFGGVEKGGSSWVRSRSLNSPVENPALAAAARIDWDGLTRADHEKLLESDAWENDALGVRPAHCYGAVQRLLFYYPKDGRSVVAKLLERTLVDYREIVELAARLEQESPDAQLVTVTHFHQTHTAQEYDALHHVVYRNQHRLRFDPRESARLGNVDAALASCFPDHKIRPDDRIHEVTYRDQAELVDTLETFDFPELHDDLFELFRRASHHGAIDVGSRYYRNELLLACTKRLRNTRNFDQCADTMRAEINELSALFRAAQSDPRYEQSGSPANQFHAFQYALNTWLQSANQVIAVHAGQ